jgi:hypothetical protein
MFKDEEELQGHIEQFFAKHNVPHKPHPTLRNGSCPDIGIKAADDKPCAIIEIKNGLSHEGSKVSHLSEYFEQCAKYHLTTGFPVFLGPWFTPRGNIVHLVQGGETSSATAAFSAIAGRVNVGLFLIHSMVPIDPSRWTGFTLMMRSTRIACFDTERTENNVWPSTRQDVKMVDLYSTAASKKQRVTR